MKIGKVMKFVRKGHKVGRIRRDGMEESGGCLWAGIFGTESAVRKRGGSRNLPYLNAKATANSVTGHVCVNSNTGIVKWCENRAPLLAKWGLQW